MNNIFIGYIFIFLNFSLNLGAFSIQLIPDFIGYIFMIKGLNELSYESERFIKLRPFAIAMCVYTAITMVLDMVGASYYLGYFSILLGLISVTVSLYISYNIIMGIEEIERKRFVYLESDKLKKTWVFMAIAQVVTMIVSRILPPVALIVGLFSFILAVVFLVFFNKTKKLYESIPYNSMP